MIAGYIFIAAHVASVLETAAHSSAIIYTVGLFAPDDQDANPGVLRRLSRATGGAAFFPQDLDEVVTTCERIAHDIRNQYTLAYYPTNEAHDGTFRTVAVQVTPPRGAGKLTVRTRTGYYASRAPSSGN